MPEQGLWSRAWTILWGTSVMPEQEGAMWTIIRKVGRVEHKREVHERFLPPELVEQLKKVLHP